MGRFLSIPLYKFKFVANSYYARGKLNKIVFLGFKLVTRSQDACNDLTKSWRARARVRHELVANSRVNWGARGELVDKRGSSWRARW